MRESRTGGRRVDFLVYVPAEACCHLGRPRGQGRADLHWPLATFGSSIPVEVREKSWKKTHGSTTPPVALSKRSQPALVFGSGSPPTSSARCEGVGRGKFEK